MILMLLTKVHINRGLVREGHSTIGGRTSFPVFRARGVGLLLIRWFWGLSVHVWNWYHVNYIFLFDFDPRIVDTPIMILEDATDETLIFLSLMLLYYNSGAGDIPDIIPPGCYPFILVLYTIKCIVFPLKTRVPMWKDRSCCHCTSLSSYIIPNLRS